MQCVCLKFQLESDKIGNNCVNESTVITPHILLTYVGAKPIKWSRNGMNYKLLRKNLVICIFSLIRQKNVVMGHRFSAFSSRQYYILQNIRRPQKGMDRKSLRAYLTKCLIVVSCI